MTIQFAFPVLLLAACQVHNPTSEPPSEDPIQSRIIKTDSKDLVLVQEVLVFEPMGAERTKILSYGVGYRDSVAYDELMEFFIPANEGLFLVLKDSLEE